ncbi:MAG: hypothetical protein R6W91_07065 [Thermoplasmata archaeon]
MVRKSRRTFNYNHRMWKGRGDESLRLRDWYGPRYCRRFKSGRGIHSGRHSRNNKKLSHHGHYIRYSYRLLGRVKRRDIPPY